MRAGTSGTRAARLTTFMRQSGPDKTNRLNLWYYAQGENTFVRAHGLGMQKNLTEAFAALDSTFGPRAAPRSGRGP